MATVKLYRVEGDVPPGFVIREGATYKGRIVVFVLDPDGVQVGPHYVGDDNHEFAMAARAVLESQEVRAHTVNTGTVGERLSPAETQQFELRSILHGFGISAFNREAAAEAITKLFKNGVTS